MSRGRGVTQGPLLVALDFTPDSQAALIWACELAPSIGAKVVGLHVIHDPGDNPGFYSYSDNDVLKPPDDVAQEMMTSFLAKVRQQNPRLASLESIETILVKGIPATRILEIAKLKGAQMIVMGSRGRTGLPHLLLGSKAERVAQLSPIPVTIVKAESVDAGS